MGTEKEKAIIFKVNEHLAQCYALELLVFLFYFITLKSISYIYSAAIILSFHYIVHN